MQHPNQSGRHPHKKGLPLVPQIKIENSINDQIWPLQHAIPRESKSYPYLRDSFSGEALLPPYWPDLSVLDGTSEWSSDALGDPFIVKHTEYQLLPKFNFEVTAARQSFVGTDGFGYNGINPWSLPGKNGLAYTAELSNCPDLDASGRSPASLSSDIAECGRSFAWSPNVDQLSPSITFVEPTWSIAEEGVASVSSTTIGKPQAYGAQSMVPEPISTSALGTDQHVNIQQQSIAAHSDSPVEWINSAMPQFSSDVSHSSVYQQHTPCFMSGSYINLYTEPQYGSRQGSEACTAAVRQDAPPSRPIDPRRREEDKFLLKGKRAGLTYKEIKKRMGSKVAESTLRGRFRSLTKARKDRVRKPVWTENDIRLLREIVLSEFDELDDACYRESTRDQKLTKLSWKKVAEYIATNGGSYHFGNSTCKKKWSEIDTNR
ncbi:hypothetical protein K469DRAFT_694759 [Zopfia rhizophila CBS 207.26]|uniref:Myb-like domain-containing protein n=1 Tax=Zopfia rhizophila CBS 207.26 TaxID=1314779 RepID=A0A6A6EN44_9PEZI|nr:hypothetical protein K469DRAFT_694759 [Zopfia rhizophila CBS 207.26]